MQWLIFHVSWPSLSEVSGSATDLGLKIGGGDVPAP